MSNVSHTHEGNTTFHMNKKTKHLIVTAALGSLLLDHSALAQGTAFTYQGQLQNGASLASGSFDLSFTLYTNSSIGPAIAGPVTNLAVNVTNGLFTTTVSFPTNPFTGVSSWLALAVRTNGAASFSPPLAPRQQLTPTPYAVFAESASASNLVGTVPTGNLSGVALLNGGNAFSGNQTVNSGSVGIGTATMPKTLTVVGNGFSLNDTIRPGWTLSAEVGQTAGRGSDGNSAFFYNSDGSFWSGVMIGDNGTAGILAAGTQIGDGAWNNRTLDLQSEGGNVGIGTASPVTQLANTASNINGTDGYGLGSHSLGWYANGLGYVAGFYNPSTGSGGGLNGVVIGIANTSSRILDLNAAGSSVMAVNGNGKVGIGASNPANTLDVQGSADFTGNVGIGTTNPANPLDVHGSGDFTGNLGIGTATPNSPLAVVGNIYFGKQRANTAFTQIGDTLYLGAEQKYLGNTLLTAVGGSTDWINLMANPLSAGIMFGTSGSAIANPHANVTAVMVIKPNGRVGIGTPSPAATIEVNGNAKFDGTITATALACPVADTDLSANVALLNAVNAFTGANNTFSGNVGIGTSTPGATLDVVGTGNFHTSLGVGGVATHGTFEVGFDGGNFSYTSANAGFASTGNLGPFSPGNNVPCAIYANGTIVSTETFLAISDQRVKNIIRRSDAAHDLDTLQGIEITDFRYKDVIAHGNAPVKKVIAQQVEKVFPQAVTRHTGEVPDIYKQADIKDGWVKLATDLKVGERVKLIGEKEPGVYEVLEVRDGAFRTGFKTAAEKVFVYGREVNDFRTVDYEALSMLNVSATQELARKLETQSSEVAALSQQLAEMKQTVQQLAQTVKDAKLAALSAAPARTGGGVPGTLTTASLGN